MKIYIFRIILRDENEVIMYFYVKPIFNNKLNIFTFLYVFGTLDQLVTCL